MKKQRIAVLSLLILSILPASALAQGVTLTIVEPELDTWEFATSGLEETAVLPDTPLDFSWSATSDGGTIVGYRYGWDLVDPNDPLDPGWANGGLENVLSAPTISFSAGTHVLTVLAVDDLDAETLGQIRVLVQGPVPIRTSTVGKLKASRAGLAP